MVAKTRRKDCIARRTIGGPIATLAIIASLMLGSSPSIAGDLTASAENATLSPAHLESPSANQATLRVAGWANDRGVWDVPIPIRLEGLRVC